MLEMQRRLSRPFLALLTLPATAMGFALSVQISALSWILSTRYGLHIDEIGLVWAAGPLAGIVGQLLVGVVSDRVWFWNGRRRPFIVVGGILVALMILALPNIGLISQALGLGSVLGVAIAVALALDLSINVSFNPTRSIITDVTNEGAMRTRGYTLMQTVSGTFGVLAYGIGAVWDNYVLIYVGSALALLFSVVPSLLIEEPRTLDGGTSSGGKAAASPTAGSLMRVLMPLWGLLAYDVAGMALKIAGAKPAGFGLEITCALATVVLVGVTLTSRDRGVEFVREDLVEFRKVLAAHAFSWVGVQTMFVYMISFVQFRFPDLDATAGGQMLSRSFLVLNAVGALMPAFFFESLSRRHGQVAVHVACLALMAFGFAGVYLYGTSPTIVYALMALMGIGWAAIVSLPFAIMSQRVEQGRIGLYMGVFNLSVVLPQLLASLAIGRLIERTADKGLIFVIGAGCLAVSALAWLFVRRAGDDAAGARTAPAPTH